MDHARDRAVVKRPSQRLDVADVCLDAGNLRARDRREARQHRARAGGEVVEHDRRVPGFRELDDDMRADVACATGHEDGLGHGRRCYRTGARRG